MSLLIPLSAYILAGGKSSRMGADKALLHLAGKPLIAHAVAKLRSITPHVHILSSNPTLAAFAPLVPDLHPNTGPIGGIEAALTHSSFDWNLIYPVDVPFIPTEFLHFWTSIILNNTFNARISSAHIAYFDIFGVPQPTLLMVRRHVLPFLSQAIASGDFKLARVLEFAARELASPNAPEKHRLPFILPITERLIYRTDKVSRLHSELWQTLTEAQQAAQPLWFANLNTPEDFAEAEANIDALDT